MNVRGIIKVTERYVINNAPTLLTAIAVTGTLTTAYLTGKGTFKAAEIIQQEEIRMAMSELDEGKELTTKDKAKLVWKCYGPAAASVVTTIGCMVAANSISANRLAAIAAAYAVSDRNFGEYKEKVKEMFGEKKEGQVRTAIAQDFVDTNPPAGHIINAAGGQTLCLDRWTGRYFYSDMQTIRGIENDLAKGMYIGQEVATLADFYDALRIPVPKCAEPMGWNNDAPIKLAFDTVMAPGDTPCLAMDFVNAPFPVDGYFGRP